MVGFRFPFVGRTMPELVALAHRHAWGGATLAPPTPRRTAPAAPAPTPAPSPRLTDAEREELYARVDALFRSAVPAAPRMSAERRRELLSCSTLGRAVLDAEAGRPTAPRLTATAAATPKMSAERRRQLLAQSTLGIAVLDAAE